MTRHIVRGQPTRRGWNWLIPVLAVAAHLNGGCAQPADPDEVRAVYSSMDVEPVAEDAPRAWPASARFPESALTPTRGDEAADLWRSVRRAHPLSTQAIFVSDLRAEGSRAVVITEPPPHVSLEDLMDDVAGASVMRHAVGHDGALFDVVGTLRGDPAAIDRKLRALHLMLFGTEHGAAVHEAATARPWQLAAESHLDLSIRIDDLVGWVTDPSARFTELGTADSASWPQLTAGRRSAVYHTETSRLVVWWIPGDVPISSLRAEIRKFAVESDVVLGAVRHPAGLLVIGRERVAAPDVLPPLRAETVMLLASEQNTESLAQSFQRMHPGAGPYVSDWDWAPILLSPTLVDSEYGELLNEADHMLKGWSEQAHVAYQNFSCAPPKTWPFATRLSDLFYGQSVAYNWNTRTAGSISSHGELDVYAVGQTGALPIHYRVDNHPADHAASVARAWFASLSNPVLVRVASYAALYQIFHAFRAEVDEQKAPASDRPARAFEATMSEFWSAVHKLDSRMMSTLAMKSPFPFRLARGRVLYSPLLLSAANEHEWALARYDEALRAWSALDSPQRTRIERETLSLDPEGLEPTDIPVLARSSELFAATAAQLATADAYVARVPADRMSWIHTSAVVMSRQQGGSPYLVGGHSLYAKAPRRTAPHLQSPRPPLDALRLTARRAPASKAGLHDVVVPPSVLEARPRAGQPLAVSFVRADDHIWVLGPEHAPAVATSNLVDASELAALRIGTMRGRIRTQGATLSLNFHDIAPADQRVLATQVRRRGARHGYSEEVVAIVSRENLKLRSLRATDYDFEHPVIRVGEVVHESGIQTASVSIELTPKRLGLRAVVIELWIRIKGSISSMKAKAVLRAVELRIDDILGRARGVQIAPEVDPVILLHQEISRIKRTFDIEIETQVRDAARGFHMTMLPRRRHHA